MAWNWQQEDWPHFRWDKDALAKAEEQFLRQSGIMIGGVKHLRFSMWSRNLAISALTY